MRISTGGNVGIGATDPLRKLHVVGDFAVNTGTDEYYGVLINGGESADPKITIGDWHNSSATIHWDSSSNYLRIDSQHSTANAPIAFTGNDGATEYMRIASTGNVGIGTTSPEANLHILKNSANGVAYERLIIDGDTQSTTASGSSQAITFKGSGNVYAGAVGGYGNGTNGGVGIWGASINSGVPDLYVYSGGLVGIGTTNPAAPLHVEDAGGTGIRVSRTGNSAYLQLFPAYSSVPTIMGQGAGGLHLGYQSNTLGIRIDANNNVGIGNTAPDYKLDIGATTSIANTIRMIQANGGTAIRIGGGGGSNDVTLLRIDGQTSNFSGESDSGAFGFSLKYMGSRSGNSNSLSLFSDNQEAASQVEAITILQDGKVGIGTTGPSSKLQVSGGIQMADDTDTAVAAKVGTMRYRTGTEYVEVTGVELVTNGDFSSSTGWSLGVASPATVVISGGKLTIVSPSGEGAEAHQIILTATKTYKATVDVVVRSGQCKLQFGTGVGAQIQNISASGTYTIYKTVPSTITGGEFYLSRSGACDVDFDNISVIEVTEEDASYADMCMQTAASTYEWVNIVRNTY
jgi:hypothetical protein